MSLGYLLGEGWIPSSLSLSLGGKSHHCHRTIFACRQVLFMMGISEMLSSDEEVLQGTADAYE
jgi:hypothetical protein